MTDVNDQHFSNHNLAMRFETFRKLVETGWRIELEQIDQTSNGEWWIEKTTKLPMPNQRINKFGDVALVTWTTYVYPPKSEDWIESLNASFNSPLAAYEWLAPKLVEYVLGRD